MFFSKRILWVMNVKITIKFPLTTSIRSSLKLDLEGFSFHDFIFIWSDNTLTSLTLTYPSLQQFNHKLVSPFSLSLFIIQPITWSHVFHPFFFPKGTCGANFPHCGRWFSYPDGYVMFGENVLLWKIAQNLWLLFPTEEIEVQLPGFLLRKSISTEEEITLTTVDKQITQLTISTLRYRTISRTRTPL